MTFREKLVIWPVVGGLAYCRWQDLGKTLEEIIPKFLIAALPIVFSTIFLKYVSHVDFPNAITKNFENGELYLFCTSMLASIFYIAVRDRGNDKPGFPNQITHLLFVIGTIALSSFIFGLKRSGISLDSELNTDLSYWFLGATLIMVVLATTINNGLSSPNPIKFQKAQTDDFLSKLKQHRGDQS
jgi:amino acid transporter